MPSSLVYRPHLVDNLISHERLTSYQNVFPHANDAELVGAYVWNSSVCAAIYPLLNFAEVALRNSIDSQVRGAIGSFWWDKRTLHYKSFNPANPNLNLPFCVKAIRRNFKNAFDAAQRDKRNRYGLGAHSPSHAEVIAKTEFSTWEFILNDEFMGVSTVSKSSLNYTGHASSGPANHGTYFIWPSHLGKVFQGQWMANKPKTFLPQARQLVKSVREFRNRVSHYEPVWKAHSVASENDAVSYLKKKIWEIEQLIKLVSEDKYQLAVSHGLVSKAYRMCSVSEIRRFQRLSQPHNVKTISKLSRIVEKSIMENSAESVIIYKRKKRNVVITPM